MYEIKRTVYYSHIGADRQMRRSAMVDFMQDCCTLSRAHDSVIGPLMKQGRLLFVAYRQLDICRLPEYLEELTVRTYLFESRRVYGRRCTELVGQKGEICARSYLVSTLVNGDTLKPALMTPEEDRAIELLPAPEGYELTDRRISIPEGEPKAFEPFTTLRCQTDTNTHINNARYFDIVDELLPPGTAVKRVRCEYRSSVMPGDKLIPQLWERDGVYTARLLTEEGAPAAILEIS
ncbi:MAG: hypothetical protein IJ746_01410 [Ruminococcus sp.]|nr:hypothetical protein [Ruminococcus sp.]